jgi:hypothetical protein
MRIIAVLSWYDEPVDWLRECVASARFCDHLIAVDGPYAAFSGALEKPSSPPDQFDAIRGVWPGCTLRSRSAPWDGEIAKRDYMFRLAVAEGADWVFVIDADEVVTDVPGDLRELLASTQPHVAEATLMYEATPGWSLVPSQVRRLFRVLPGLGYAGAHSRVVAEVDGRSVSLADPNLSACEPAEAISGLRMRHRNHERSLERQSRKADYYKLLPALEK